MAGLGGPRGYQPVVRAAGTVIPAGMGGGVGKRGSNSVPQDRVLTTHTHTVLREADPGHGMGQGNRREVRAPL